MRQVKSKLKNVCQGSQFEVDITERYHFTIQKNEK